MLRTRGIGRDVGEVDLRFLTAREFDLRLFSSILQALQGEDVLAQIGAGVLAELIDDVVDEALVEVFAAQERIAVRGEHFELLVAVDVRDINDRNIERAAAQVIHGNLAIGRATLVHAEGKRRGSRFIDDALDVKARNAAGILRRLTLAVVEVGRHRNDGFRNRLAEVILSGLLHLAKHFSRNLLRSELLAGNLNPRIAIVRTDNAERRKLQILLDFRIVETTTDQTLHGEERVLRIRDGLTLCGSADENLTVFHVRNDRRRCAGAFTVLDDLDVIAFHDGDRGVRRTKVYTDDLCHV